MPLFRLLCVSSFVQTPSTPQAASAEEDQRPGAPRRSGKLQIYYSSTTSSRETRRHNELLKSVLERENVPGAFSTWIPLDLCVALRGAGVGACG
eukprot:m.89992 g.89992  ORF g.89992 m.89992 type:complete len:94 (+) comp18145_c0_seq4:999-1280(+)